MSAKLVKKNAEVIHSVAAAGTAVNAGDVVILGSNICGVAARNIAAGQSGVVYLTGVFEFPVSSLTAAIGAKAYWNASTGVTTTNTDAYLGVFVTTATGNTAAQIAINI